MLPIGDDDFARRTTPIVTYALIAINVLFFLVELSAGNGFIEKYSVIPKSTARKPSGGVHYCFHCHVHACRLAASGR